MEQIFTKQIQLKKLSMTSEWKMFIQLFIFLNKLNKYEIMITT